MKLSARNQIKGEVVEVTKGATTSHVRIDIGGGNIITASITNIAVEELGLTVGKAAYAVIKASDVMVGLGWIERAAKRLINHHHPTDRILILRQVQDVEDVGVAHKSPLARPVVRQAHHEVFGGWRPG